MTAPDERSYRYPGWRIAAAASGAIFFSFGSLLVFVFGVFLKPIALEFRWSREAVSAAFGVAALCLAACSPGLGALLDRMPPRRVILPCFAIFGVGLASLALLRGPLWHLYVIFAMLGLVGNGTAHLAYAGAVSSWFRERRGAAFALLMAGSAMGAIIWPVAAQRLIDAAGWRGAFALLGLLVLVIGLPLAARVKRRTGWRAERQETSGLSVAQSLRSSQFWIIITILFAASLGQNGANSHMAALLTDRGVASGYAALALSVVGAAALVGRLATGWLLDRFFAPSVSFVLLATAALGTWLLARAHSAGGGYLAAALIGLGMGAEADTTPYLLSRYFGLRSFSTLYGLSWTAYAIAGGVGPVIMGRAFDATGSYEVLLVRLSLGLLATAPLMLLLPRYPAFSVQPSPDATAEDLAAGALRT